MIFISPTFRVLYYTAHDESRAAFFAVCRVLMFNVVPASRLQGGAAKKDTSKAATPAPVKVAAKKSTAGSGADKAPARKKEESKFVTITAEDEFKCKVRSLSLPVLSASGISRWCSVADQRR